jgi:short-subunit dehydrogenase
MSNVDGSVIITGGSKGIGLSIAKVFARETTHPLVLIARNKEDLLDAKSECMKEGAEDVHYIVADVTQEDDISSIDFEQFKPSVLINNAGSFLFRELGDTTAKEFKSQFEVNTFGAFQVTKKVLPALLKRKKGLIVNISSIGAVIGMDKSGAYSMSKHALLGYTRSLRKELKNSNVGVTAINLGQTYSTSWQEIDVDAEKIIDPEDVGKLIVTLSRLSKRTVVEELIMMPQGGEVDPV